MIVTYNFEVDYPHLVQKTVECTNEYKFFNSLRDMNVFNQFILIVESKNSVYQVDSHADYESTDIGVDLEGEFILDSFRNYHGGSSVHYEYHQGEDEAEEGGHSLRIILS